jgi:hypothetical protein
MRPAIHTSGSAPEIGMEPGCDEWLTAAAGKHASQLSFLLDKSRSKMVLAGRQSGKSWAVICSMFDTVCRRPMGQALYMTFSAAAAERTTWRLALEIVNKYAIDAKVDQRKQTITFPNGGIVAMLGADDVAHMETFRGGKSDIIVVDEVGAQPTRVLQPLIDEILEPQLRATNGTMVVIGTPPRAKVGWFAEQWHNGGDWRRWHWTGKENVWCPGFDEFVARIASRRGVDVNHPSIRREYFAEWVDDMTSSVIPAYSERCVYEPARVPLTTVDGWSTALEAGEMAAIGCDPGSRDRMAVQVAAWNPSSRVRQVGEWVTPRDARTTIGTLAGALRELLQRFPGSPVYVDTSHTMVADTLGRDWHLGLIASANKDNRQAQIDRLNELAATGGLMVGAKSKLDEDMRLTEWDEAKADPGPYRRYSRSHHPDALDAFRYALSHAVLQAAAVRKPDRPAAREVHRFRFDDYR